MIRKFTDIISILNESQCVELNQHRGEPDPQKVKQRQEAHKRGLERHENALQRQQELEKARKQRQQDLQATKKAQQKSKMSAEEVQQKSAKVKQALQKLKTQQQIKKQQEEAAKKQKELKDKQKQTSLVVRQQFNNAITKAPTDATKENCKELDKRIQEINQIAQKQQKQPQQVEKEYNKVVDELEDKLKSDEEKNWFRKISDSNLVKCASAAFDAWWDLFGFKDITDDITSVGKKYTGISAYQKNKDKSQKESKKQKPKDNIDKSIRDKVKRKRLKKIDEIMKEGYSRAEAQRIYNNKVQKGIEI